MKYIPLESFDQINSLLQNVDALGCSVTLRLEAFTCRYTKDEREVAQNIANFKVQTQTPPISPSPYMAGQQSTFESPPPLVLGAASEPLPTPVLTPDNIDERHVFFVAALNMLYGSDGYDFSILSENDFICYEEADFKSQLRPALSNLPEICLPAVNGFWPAIEEQVMDAAQGCEYYEFKSPSCDPLAEHCVFSHHFFIYNKRRKVLVMLVFFGEGNMYRGDDGQFPRTGSEGGVDRWDERLLYNSSAEPYTQEDDDDEEYEGKNRDFYGY